MVFARGMGLILETAYSPYLIVVLGWGEVHKLVEEEVASLTKESK